MLELCKSLRDDLSIGAVSPPSYALPFDRTFPYTVKFAAAELVPLDTAQQGQGCWRFGSRRKPSWGSRKVLPLTLTPRSPPCLWILRCSQFTHVFAHVVVARKCVNGSVPD